MSDEDDERTTLLSGSTQPRYVLHSAITRRRHRRLRQFQCCVCAILLCATVIILIFAVSYGINRQLTTEIPTPEFQNDSSLLFALSWPIADENNKNGSYTCVANNDDWQEALIVGMEALHKKDQIEKDISALNVGTPSYKHYKSFASSTKSRSLAKLAYIKENAQKYLCGKGIKPSAICNESQPGNFVSCNVFQKYRSCDGACNNLNRPLEFGVAFTPFRRALPPDYADGISDPRTAKDGKLLPSARTVSLVVHRPIYRNDNKFTVMLAVWGQFIDHDITATAINQGSQGKSISCCSKAYHPECFPVKIDHNDPFYSKYNVTCLEFVRSALAPTSELGPRQQLNQVSAFLDASVVYGSDENVTKKLREFQDGKLKMLTVGNRTLLPISTDPADGCNRVEQNTLGRYCFMTGDQRANENLHLTSMHLIWARHHNNLATKLKSVNPHWEDERIFQEARRILAAQMQHITYNEFLTILFGSTLMKKSDLFVRNHGYYKGYDSNVDASIANNFATAAFRFGHTLIPALVKLLNNNFSNPEYVHFHRILFNPYSLYQHDGLDKSLRGAMNTTVEASDTYFNEEVKNRLFEETNKNSSNTTTPCGLDLVSLNIQRGRDHGIPGYSNWREHCGLLRPRNFSELVGDIDDDSLAHIQLIYRDVDDIDLYTGGISEKPLKGGILGPTFTCLILDQFVRLKRGDRMWYETDTQPQAFTPRQLEQIRLTSLAGIICDNSDKVDYVQPHVMQRVGEGNEYTPCIAIPRPDLTKWKDADLPRIRISDNSISVKSTNSTSSDA